MKQQTALNVLLSAAALALMLLSVTLIPAAHGSLSAQSSQTTTPVPATPPAAIPTVTANAQWTAQTQRFDGVDMMLVPPGCFLMGTSDADIAALNKQYNTIWFSDQAPQSKICFDQSFWIDKTDVTQAQFKRLSGTAAHSSSFTGDNRPVERITWLEARDFCAKQRDARLPTEAEWEYAARGPDSLAYPWGNAWNAANAVAKANSGHQTADVGSKPGGVSWVGALDMSGNVWQWTSSLYQPYPYKADDGRESNSDTNNLRVLRGGSWNSDVSDVRTAGRNGYAASGGNNNDGFRCARSFESANLAATP